MEIPLELNMRKGLLLSASFILLTSFILDGCSRDAEIQGSVFIVTQGAENYKLGLVKIVVIPESEIATFVEQKKKAVGDAASALNSNVEPIKNEIEKSQQDSNDSIKNYDEVNNQKNVIKAKADVLNGQFNPYLLTPSPYLSEFETPEEVSERNKQRQIGKQLTDVRKQLASYEAKVAQLEKVKANADNQLKSAKSKLTDLSDKMKGYLNPNFLLEGIPQGNIKSVTDADGKFTFKLAKGKYAFFASSQRRVNSSTEEYQWLVWVTVDSRESPNIILSNQNLLGQDSEDSIFKFKELNPILENPLAELTKRSI